MRESTSDNQNARFPSHPSSHRPGALPAVARKIRYYATGAPVLLNYGFGSYS
jgi:hypothetical protein